MASTIIPTIINSGGGGGGGAVDSVNGKTGVVVLDAADVGAATAAQGVKADAAVQSANDTLSGAMRIDRIVSIEQADYDALTPDDATLYVIVD